MRRLVGLAEANVRRVTSGRIGEWSELWAARSAIVGHASRGLGLCAPALSSSARQREEMAGNAPEEADEQSGRQICSRVVELSREFHLHLPGLGNESWADAFAQGAQSLAHDLRVHASMQAREAT